MQIPRNEFACKFQETLQMGQKVMIRFRLESGLSSGTETISPLFADLSSTRLYMFTIVFGDSSLYPKQLHLFCPLWLIRASADRIGCIRPANFFSMIELLHELKNISC